MGEGMETGKDTKRIMEGAKREGNGNTMGKLMEWYGNTREGM